MGLYDLYNEEYNPSNITQEKAERKSPPKPSYAELYEEIAQEEDSTLPIGSQKQSDPEAIRKKIRGTPSSIVSKLKHIGFNIDEFNYPNSKFDIMKLLKCLYKYEKQEQPRLLTIFEKPSLEMVDNFILINNLSEKDVSYLYTPNRYGAIINNFKKEIEPLISPKWIQNAKIALSYSIKLLSILLVDMDNDSIMSSQRNVAEISDNLTSFEKQLNQLHIKHQENKNTVFEVMYLKTIIFEDIGRGSDLIQMEEILDRFDKLIPPISTVLNTTPYAIDFNHLEEYIKEKRCPISLYISQGKNADIDVLAFLPQLELLLIWRDRHRKKPSYAEKTPKRVTPVAIIASLQTLWLLQQHLDFKYDHKYYGWQADNASLYSKVMRGEGLSEFYQIVLVQFSFLCEHHFRWGAKATTLLRKIEHIVDTSIKQLNNANSIKEMAYYCFRFYFEWSSFVQKLNISDSDLKVRTERRLRDSFVVLSRLNPDIPLPGSSCPHE